MTRTHRVGSSNTIRPIDLAQARDALAEGTGRVMLSGAGTASDWAGHTERPELVLDTTGLTGVLAHNPSDMTVQVLAGTPLRELNETLAEHGQRVALDAARVAAGATVGGLIATADSGPGALRYGSSRDLVIGATLVLADGTVARTGGHVIKNVAGYDLTKLVHGSHGTLALVTEVVLRLHPVPGARATVRLPCTLPEGYSAAASVLASPLEPVALEWFEQALSVELEGDPATLDGRVRRLGELLAEHGAATRLPEADAREHWARHAELVSRPPERMAMLRLGARPSRLVALLTELTDTLGGRRVAAGLATGIATVALPADAAAVAAAHRRAHQVGATSMLRARPPGANVPALGAAPSALGVLRAVKTELDPHNRLGAGRFTPWL
jgi:glycolate oxidase FAD binding subunit